MALRTTRDFGCSLGWRGFRKSLLSGVALGAALMGTGHAQTPPDAATPPKKTSGTEEVIVTAQRRVQNLQDVPVSIQVLSGATLKHLNVENFDDLVAQLPNVTSAGFGPGQDNIYVRGLSLGGTGSQESGILGSFPNVAVYLDDQSAQVPGRNLDIYAVDLQRVEVLEGPQGTLFGSGAQAGVVRYITNKPDLTKYGGNVDLGGALTEHGNPSGNIDATVNIPVVKDKLAVRITAYDDDRGGYINNVPGTFVRESTDYGIHYAGYTNNIPGPPNATNSANNYKLAKNDINPVRYEGFRGEALLKFNDDWNALLSESFQQMHAEGVFYEEPYTSGSSPVKLPPLSVETFNGNFDQDSFENTGLTINGRLGVLNLVYDGAYLVRHVTQQQDYTNYARGVYGDYYQCQPANAAKGTPAKCYSPAATWNSNEADSHLSQEFRVSTPDTWRLRGIGGFYYENFKVVENTNFNYLTDTGNFTPIGAAPGSGASDPNIRSPNTGFFTDAERGYTQYAIFGSADFDIIPKVLTATFGTRWFDFYDYEKGFVGSSFYCSQEAYTGPAPCIGAASHNLTAKGLQNRAYGFKSRANLTYKITPEILVYYTWSQGYRPGGYNRTEIAGVGGYFFASDSLTNNEVGYKASFFDNRLILDGAFYDERWDNVQAEVFDPGVFGNLSFVTNGPNFRVLGTELQATGRPTDDLTLNANVALNDSKQTSTPLFEGTPLFGANGTLAQSPAFKTSFRARYEWTESTYEPFVQLSLTHSSHSHSAAAGNLITLSPDFYLEKPIYNFLQDPITRLDLSAGMSYGPWSGSVYIDNVTNERGQNFISATQFVQSVIVDRPLTAGVKLTYRF